MRQLWAGLAAVSLVAILAACDSAKAAKPTGQNADQMIVAGWRDAMSAFFTAAEEPTGPDSSYSALTENVAQPLLGRLQSLLSGEAKRGWLVRGPWALGDPRVTSVQDGTATVVSCVAGGDVVVDPRTNHPLPGELGQPNMVGTASTMSEVGGRWVESDAHTESFPYQGGQGSCGASY
jgi:hypothetical protein